MLKRIAPLTDQLIITRPQTERATPPGEIVPVALRYNHRNVEVIENSRDALKRALSLADLNDLICVAGSLYLVGEVKRVF
jgi:dihydrofolate synthase/folylpolyglutamate synthase